MSRSHRKVPITGVTTSESEKHDKIIAHRRYRHAVRDALTSGKHDKLPHWYEYSDPWLWDKDGKYWHTEWAHPWQLWMK